MTTKGLTKENHGQANWVVGAIRQAGDYLIQFTQPITLIPTFLVSQFYQYVPGHLSDLSPTNIVAAARVPEADFGSGSGGGNVPANQFWSRNE